MNVESYMIRPVGVTLVSSNAPEPVALWNSGTAYTAGQLARSAVTNRIYKALQNTTGVNPVTDNGDFWADVDPSNTYAMFDGINATQTLRTGGLTTVFSTAEFADSLGLTNLLGTSLSINVASGATPIYSATFSLLDDSKIVDFWTYYYEELSYVTKLTLNDVPIGSNYTWTLNIMGGATGVGETIPGSSKNIGLLLTGSRLSFTDYSVKERDDFGKLSLTERGFSDGGTFDLIIEKERFDDLYDTVVSYRAKPLVFVMTKSNTSAQIFGVVMDFQGMLAGKTYIEYSATIEGMT